MRVRLSPSPLSRRVMLAGLAALASCKDEASPSSPALTASPSGTTPSPPAARVEVWHDTVCPWCRIGLHNLGVALDGLAGRSVEVVYHPYLLDPDTPDEGADLRARLGAKYGSEKVASMFDGVTQAGARQGVRFDFGKVLVAPQTAPSHALVAAAPAGKRRAVLEALHVAYFERGENIGEAAVLARAARAAGLDEGLADLARSPARVAEIRASAAAASRSGIRGVPHFVIGGRTLHGAQGPEVLREAITAS